MMFPSLPVTRRRFLSGAVATIALSALAGRRADRAVAQQGLVIAIDPGHGGRFNGSAGRFAGTSLLEKDVNLDVSLRVAELLRNDGVEVVLTRDRDVAVSPGAVDLNENGQVDEDDDLQARVDVANQAGAALFFSIHHNGGPAAARGTSVFFCEHHPRAEEARALAQLLQAQLLDSLREIGYAPLDLGALDDAMLNKPYGHLFLAGPATPRVARPSLMPTVVGEALFLSHPTEGAMLLGENVRQALAGAYYTAARQFAELSGTVS